MIATLLNKVNLQTAARDLKSVELGGVYISILGNNKTIKIILINLFLFMFCNFSKGQVTTLQFDKNIEAYLEVNNPITIGIENNCCDSIFIISKYKRVIRSSINKCNYTYFSKSIMPDSIYFYKITQNSDTILIDTKMVRMKNLPLVATYRSKIDRSKISKKELVLFPLNFGITAHNTGLDIFIQIDSFKASIKRNCKITFEKFYKRGDNFNDLLKEFSKLEKDDEINFSSILYTLNEGLRQSEDMLLIIE